jgi:repressor of nif and glnA expression
MGFEVQDVERKIVTILKVLSESQTPLGARLIAQRLQECGIELGERAVRYHLKLLDERGLTQLLERRQGRILTDKGNEEVKSALVRDKIGYAISKIELLSFRTDFDYEKRCGLIPVNISFFPKDRFTKAFQIMKPAFEAGYCVSDLVAVASEGEQLGDLFVPPGKVGIATVCSIVINGSLLKAGVPMDSRFGGILQIQNHSPLRFVELINYTGCTLDPSEVFIRARMTSVQEAARVGEGRILANFREIPTICKTIADEVLAGLKEAGLGGLLLMGNTSETVCEIPVELNKIGMILVGGLNPVAAAEEAGIEAESHAMSTVMEYQSLVKYQEVTV